MKNNDIDFIKWMCDKADGFDFIRKQDDDEFYVGFNNRAGDYFSEGNYRRFVYPLLIQRAIEGVTEKLLIDIEPYWLASYGWNYDIDFNDKSKPNISNDGYFETPDQAKESALKYIYEQEINTNE
jgi:hypothetical protein